jgi:hypothetical protein
VSAGVAGAGEVGEVVELTLRKCAKPVMLGKGMEWKLGAAEGGYLVVGLLGGWLSRRCSRDGPRVGC